MRRAQHDARRRYEDQAGAARENERQLLERGELTAADRMRDAEFAKAIAIERARLAAMELAAERVERTASEIVEQARASVVEARRKAEAIGRHRSRWEGERAKSRLAREELAAEEAHAARNTRGPRRSK